ncbi:MAG: glycosyltransferase family 39 protein [Acidobacteria bacterium]|nr:glycosyltransferase family 39 protein [Acidobacteriota bacterium]
MIEAEASRRTRILEWAGVAVCVIALSVTSLVWVSRHGFTLYFGDAEAHLNIARRIIDSRTPGVDQFGTVWLPVPHLLMLPFVWNDELWRTGLAGGIASAIAFVAASLLIYATTRRLFDQAIAAASAVAVFALNPNILYLQSIPMTECAFFAALLGLLFTSVWFHQTRSVWAALAAAAFSNIASMTRYEGWFLIPFVALYLLWAGGRRRWWAAFLFGAVASIGPLLWLGFNWWNYRNPLEFYNGPYSAKAIYERGRKDFPGEHHWIASAHYFWEAARLTLGLPLILMGLGGAGLAAWRRRWWPVLLLAAPPAFYVWSMYGSGAEIHVPTLWPHSYYNTRYGTTLAPLLAFGVAALVSVAPGRLRAVAAGAAVLAASAPWLMHPSHEEWICWKESKVNSDSRRAWTAGAAEVLKSRYKPGDGVFTEFGDLTGIIRAAGVHQRDTLHEGNNPQWMVTERRPALFLKEGWAVAFSGDAVATAVQRANRVRPSYELVARVFAPWADVVEIYRRVGGDGAIGRLCKQGLIANCEPAGKSPEDSGEEQ